VVGTLVTGFRQFDRFFDWFHCHISFLGHSPNIVYSTLSERVMP
jgi:hypothetical protein